MRTIQEVRAAFVDDFRNACLRPGMYGGEPFLRWRLSDLRLIDGATSGDGDWDAIIATLGVRHLSTQSVVDLLESALLGRAGQLGAQLHRLWPAAASVYAEVGWRLGYVDVRRTLAAGEWRTLRAALRGFGAADVRAGEVEARFGPPSWARGRDVLCYAPAKVPALAGQRWVSFDCAVDPRAERAWLAARDDASRARRREALRADDPPVRDVRWWTPRGAMRVRLTPHGRPAVAWLAKAGAKR